MSEEVYLRAKGRDAQRESNVADAFVKLWPISREDRPWLVCEDTDGYVQRHLTKHGVQAVRWSRWTVGTTVGTTIPPDEPYAGAIIRLPKAVEALNYLLHMVAERLTGNQPIWLYGANDEGIKSAGKRLAPLFDSVRTIGVKNRCRLWQGARSAAPAKGSLDEWWSEGTLCLAQSETTWYHLPGVFARGALDDGTALLLESIPDLAPRARVLDFGCGTGVIAAAVRHNCPTAALHLLDADSLALAAAQRNIPHGQCHPSDGWSLAPPGPFDLIVSNPPIHRGRSEDYQILTDLLEKSARHLTPKGRLVLVGQTRIHLDKRMRQNFSAPVKLAQNNRFQVWCNQ